MVQNEQSSVFSKKKVPVFGFWIKVKKTFESSAIFIAGTFMVIGATGMSLIQMYVKENIHNPNKIMNKQFKDLEANFKRLDGRFKEVEELTINKVANLENTVSRKIDTADEAKYTFSVLQGRLNMLQNAVAQMEDSNKSIGKYMELQGAIRVASEKSKGIIEEILPTILNNKMILVKPLTSDCDKNSIKLQLRNFNDDEEKRIYITVACEKGIKK